MARPASTLAARLAAVMLALAVSASRADAVSVLAAEATCVNGNQVYVSWVYYPGTDPIEPPGWVGYDVVRRAASPCGPFVRLNNDVIPRGIGAAQGHEFFDTSVLGASHHYRIVPVDANRNPVALLGDIHVDAYQACPDATTPAMIGTVDEDWGWAVHIAPCAESCWPGAYVDLGPYEEVLRGYVGSGVVFNFYGDLGCGTVEGCGLLVNHVVHGVCAPTPSRATSWGQLKSSYR